MYLALVDKATPPADGDPIVLAFLFEVGGANAPAVRQLNRSDFGEIGVRFQNGIAWCLSTTAEKVTLSTDTLGVISALRAPGAP